MRTVTKVKLIVVGLAALGAAVSPRAHADATSTVQLADTGVSIGTPAQEDCIGHLVRQELAKKVRLPALAAALAAMFVAAALTISALLTAPAATADVKSFYDSLHAQGITSTAGDQALFNAGTLVCKDTAFYIHNGGDWQFFAARRKAAEDLVNDNLQRPRNEMIILTNTAINELCPQYNYTWVAE